MNATVQSIVTHVQRSGESLINHVTRTRIANRAIHAHDWSARDVNRN